MSFFTTPASQRKRKRDDKNEAPAHKRRTTSGASNAKTTKTKPARARRDESIESSGSESEKGRRNASDEEPISESDSEDENETGAERRLLLAEKYLQNLKGEVEDEIGFDAADVDRDLLAERLQEDVAETQGKLFRQIASTYDFSGAVKTNFRYGSLSTTSCATCPPYAYTVSKDIQLIKWELSTPDSSPKEEQSSTQNPKLARRRPVRLITAKGKGDKQGDPSYQGHTASILCVAASTTGKFVATGGADKRLVIWSASDLKPLRVFTQHRDAVTALAFRRGTNQLYSCSSDRTIKTWSLDELAYVETLFGHQDQVVDVAALAMERCVSVGARDRSARLWKVIEETQLVFRSGGSSEKKRPKKKDDPNSAPKSYSEGSVDRVALVSEEIFVTGSDNGSLSLWSLQKKKPVFTIPVAHGLDPALKPEEISADVTPNMKIPERQPRWITALAAVPFSDLVLSGSWDGCIRVWRVTADKRQLEAVGVVGRPDTQGESANGDVENKGPDAVIVSGYINDLSVLERGERGKDGLCIVAGTGTEPRLGRWKKVPNGKNGAVVFEMKMVEKGTDSTEVANEDEQNEAKDVA